MRPTTRDVRDDPAEQRYELAVGGGNTAYAAYDRAGDVIVFTHTVVPPANQGEGLGTTLVAGALADVRRRGLRVIPQCPFVASYMNVHPDTQDLLTAPD
ncbi:MAG: GNAT family N-acetyltransferase [Janthinobacterium lividum]